MPSSDQPCSSSPMSLRSGSAESVVLPVPESPKNSATSSSRSPTFAEQCIGMTPCSVGSTKFRTLKMLFLISPAYPVPATRTTLREKSMPTKVSDSVSSSSGSARKPGRSEEHTSELQSRQYLVCRLLLEKKKKPHMITLSTYTFDN